MQPEEIEQLKERGIATLGLSPDSVYFLVRKVLEARSLTLRNALVKLHGLKTTDLQRIEGEQQLFAMVTVGDVVAFWSTLIKKCRSSGECGRLPGYIHFERLKEALGRMGLTRAQWQRLYNGTPEAKATSKEAWLDEPMVALGTLSTSALESFPDPAMSVRELLATEVEGFLAQQLLRSCRTSFVRTREKLRELGFTYEDGPFMQTETKRALVELVMKTCGLGQTGATFFVETAKQMGWGTGRPHIAWTWDE